ncbi:TolB family protein [candidate division KSB1 bacterium]|nr:TolB family protein [candidate division KSB1 bacterium]
MNQSMNLGVFETASDIGNVKLGGESLYDPATDQYHLKGAGTNMWYGEDEFQFLWKKMSSDFILDAQVSWVGEGANVHRKAGLAIRETLETGSRHVSAEYHGGDGLMSMQYRLEVDSLTLEQSSEDHYLPMMRLEKSGNIVRMYASKPGDLMQQIGEIELPFDSTSFYVGLIVCSHDSNVVEEAVFKNVRLTVPAKPDFVPYRDYIGCRLEILDIESGLRKVTYQSQTPFEAPNWSPDGSFLVVNSQGKLYRIPAAGGELTLIDTDFATSNNNDHGFSPDGKTLALSHHAKDRPSGKNSVIYTVPVTGGVPTQITEKSPSYWHGWSPDGTTLIYTANRNEQWDLYGIPATGGEEVQLTNNPGLDDGSEFSFDGKHIWFNSNRTGTMEIWKMKSDGSEQTQITDDAFQNWFPHQSPDGKWLVYLAFPPEVDLWDHPYYKHITLRLMNLEDMSSRVIAYLYGGQGTINVPSWSPDSKKVAFVSNSDGLK